MARSTVYTLYKTGRIDPTLTHIWAFRSPSERYTWFNRKASLEFTANKYWRVGNPIKIPISYETSFEYDYIRIINDAGTQQQREWYAFISARAYVSPSVTLLTLDVDYIQTFYFTGQVPFWDASGFIVKATGSSSLVPLPGTASDYPVPQSRTISFTYQTGDYAFLIYSTINVIDVMSSDEPHYMGMMSDGVFSAVAVYLVGGQNAGQTLTSVISKFNNSGYTEAIAAIYAVPADYFDSVVLDGQVHGTSDLHLRTRTITIAKPVGQGQYDHILSDYDYTYIVLSNGQGEDDVYHFFEFNGNPTFSLGISITGGFPTLICTPANLKYNALDAAQIRSVKITQAISCVYLNDSYKIWLAQTQNSRAAALEGANLAIAQAKEAREKSWMYQFGGIVERQEQQSRDTVTGTLADIIGGAGEFFGRNMGNTGISSVGRNFSKSDTGITDLDAPVHTYGSRYRELQTDLKTSYDLMTRNLNYQLGIETRYTYDHAVANAQQSLNELVAGWKDKARIPATARGSNAYGDLALLKQYGFMFAVYGPEQDVYSSLDQMLAASGYSVNRYGVISDYHQVFDYYQVNSAKIPVNIAIRPEFVRKMMLDLLQRGVYLWYIKDGDISPYIGSPMGLSNPLMP